MSKNEFKVDFFIVGMQRAGTTSLSRYLSYHPNVVMSLPKEPHYFADDLPSIRTVSSEIEYRRLFKGQSEGKQLLGEASTGYLFSKTALGNIYKHNKSAKILVMLRNPADMIHSLHSHLLYCGHEDVPEFSSAWSMQELRKEGKSLPKDPRFHDFTKYYEVGCIGSQVERLLSIFPESQIKFILFDDFIHSPKDVYEDILRFLGLESDNRTDFFKLNENRTYWLPGYYKLRYLIPWRVRASIDRIYHIFGTKPKIARMLFSSSKKSKRLSSNERRMLAEVFSSEVKKLERLIGRDLSGWIASGS